MYIPLYQCREAITPRLLRNRTLIRRPIVIMFNAFVEHGIALVLVADRDPENTFLTEVMDNTEGGRKCRWVKTIISQTT